MIDLLIRIERLTNLLKVLSKPNGDVDPKNVKEYNKYLTALKQTTHDLSYAKE